ncbi:hypothetical protein [Anaerobutyricum hallii]|jgi:hypothetical protein|uniref:hypothetical protein n=1 Tax=Anaerobutyricum hallii TaxID=39488 RepID=UPI00205E4971|nr:hypothetical protein [Anaerobutyricum hallii]DAG61120.1 MAG TPA: hypothetical protein [Caudoviricetes sp.]DAK62092.1 MAG TPA: hypothetical protein [Caudoviricetes sp.]
MINPIMNFIQMLRNAQNPQQMMVNTLKQQTGNNPVMNNALQMMEKGDGAGIEKLARNLCKERNVNADEMFKQVKEQFEAK